MYRLLFCLTSLALSLEGCSQVDPIDQISRYSYLMLQKKPTLFNSSSPLGWDPTAEPLTSTGFFVQRNSRLFLVSAKHVLSGFDCFPAISKVGYEAILYVRYVDTLNYWRFQPISLAVNMIKEARKPCFESPDVDFVEVTGLFSDARLNIVPLNEEDVGDIAFGTEVIMAGFGISGTVNKTMRDYFISAHPARVSGSLQQSSSDPLYLHPQMSESFYFLNTYIESGNSGAPAFAVLRGKKTKIKFIGVQSASDLTYKFSYLVKKKVLLSLLP